MDESELSQVRWHTIAALVDDAGDRFGSIEGLVSEEVRYTFAELRDEIHRAARAYMAHGIQPGDRIAVWAPNIWEWVVVALGAHCAGAVLVPINTRFKGREAGYVLEKSGARMLVTVTDFIDTDYVAMLAAAGAGQGVEHTIVLRGAVPDGCVDLNGFLAAADTVTEADRQARSAAISGDDLGHIMFTSGTTGLPKGAMLTHSAICRAYWAWASVVGLRERDRYLIANPFFHSFGMNSGILACLMKGATMIPQLVLDIPDMMRRVQAEQVTMLPGPPAVYQTILNHPDLSTFDLSSLRLSVTGAAAIPVEMIYAMREKLAFETIVTGYGLTETTGIATMCRHDDDPETIALTSGRAIPDVEVRIVDDDGHELPRGEPGEIVIRGYNIMKGYLDDPEQTAETIDAEGWLHSGDIGVMDERGYIKITDRKKDMFIVGGFNAYPAEIENVMMTHPDIASVAVIGVPDDRLGEVGMAYVVARTGSTPDPAEIVSWCRVEMANYKVPRRVEIVDALPLNASGKVLKFELRDRATRS